MKNTYHNEEHSETTVAEPKTDCPWWENLSIHEFYLAATYCSPTEWETIGLY